MTPWQPALAMVPLLVGEFSTLPAGDVIEVHVESTGCFHSDGYELTFRGGETKSVSLRETGTRWRGPEVPPTPENTRPIPVTPEELRHLDIALDAYRLRRFGACTTTDKIRFTHFRAGRLLAREQFVDGTCDIRYSLRNFAWHVHWEVYKRQAAELRAAER